MKRKSGSRYLEEETCRVSKEEVTEKTINTLHILGNQTFAVSPFSEYFDTWLTNLQKVLAEFESNFATDIDDQFVKERSQILADVKLELEDKKRKEHDVWVGFLHVVIRPELRIAQTLPVFRARSLDDIAD